MTHIMAGKVSLIGHTLNLVIITTHLGARGIINESHLEKWIINEIHLACDLDVHTESGSITQVTTAKVLQAYQMLNTQDSPPMFTAEEAFKLNI